MELEKLQKFLRNKHKFDRKPENFELVENLTQKCEILCKLIKNGDKDNVDTVIAHEVVELIKLCNHYDIELADVLVNKLKFGV